MGVLDWAPTPAQNAGADPGIRAADGTSARDLPSAVRGVMAATAALALDRGGALISTGADNVYVVETHSGLTTKPGTSFSFWADRDNTDAAALNVDGSGPRRWYGADGLPLLAGSIQGGLHYTVAWAGPEVGKLPGWYITGSAGAFGTTTGVAFDYSGTLAERAQYDARPRGVVYLAVADTPLGPSWTLYLKQSSAQGDWSSGLPIKANPAQSTADAIAAADAAAAQRALAAQQAAAAQAQAQAAGAAQASATQQASAAAGAASQAAASAIEAAHLASLVGALSYDMGTLSQPSDGSTNFDFGSAL